MARKNGKELEQILGAVLSASEGNIDELKQEISNLRTERDKSNEELKKEVSELRDLIQKMISGGFSPSTSNQTTTSSRPQQQVPSADSRSSEEVAWDKFFSDRSINDDDKKKES